MPEIEVRKFEVKKENMTKREMAGERLRKQTDKL